MDIPSLGKGANEQPTFERVKCRFRVFQEEIWRYLYGSLHEFEAGKSLATKVRSTKRNEISETAWS